MIRTLPKIIEFFTFKLEWNTQIRILSGALELLLEHILSYTEFVKLSYHHFMTFRRYAWYFILKLEHCYAVCKNRWLCPPTEGEVGVVILLLVWIPTALLIVCTVSSKPMGRFSPNLHTHIIRREERSDKILVTLTSFSRSHQHFEKFSNFDQKKLVCTSWTKWQILAKPHIL